MSVDAKDFMRTLSTAGRRRPSRPPPIPGFRWVWVDGWHLEVSEQ